MGDRLYARIGSLEARARTCWWECFDLGHLGRVRAHIFRLCRSFGYLTDWLHGGASALGHENFDKSHVESMNALRKDLSALSKSSMEKSGKLEENLRVKVRHFY